jgi:hypothetical protein
MVFTKGIICLEFMLDFIKSFVNIVVIIICVQCITNITQSKIFIDFLYLLNFLLWAPHTKDFFLIMEEPVA